MLGYVIVTLVFAISVLFFCKILLSYLYHAVGTLSERDLKKIRFRNKVAFGLAVFWKRISEAKEIPNKAIKEGAQKMPADVNEKPRGTISIEEFREKRGRERESQQNQKRYKIKENM